MGLIIIVITGAAFISCKSNDTPKAAKSPVIDTGQVFYPVDIKDMRARDPFILTDPATKTYYLIVNNNPKFKVYSSKNLKKWKDDGNCFTASVSFWGKNDFWAPDVYAYKGKYYLFATFSATGVKRGTSILVADKPGGPYQPLVNHAATPANWMSLDGTLYIDDDNKPWLIFCHEWLEAIDGAIVAQRLTEDLTATVGEPVTLFTASKAAWTGTIRSSGVTGYVTDAPFIYKAKNGELLMTWSSFTKAGKYAIGLSRSESGTLSGPWKHDGQPLNNDDGGHAMLFNDFAGNLMISYHSPNSSTERPVIYKVTDADGKLTIIK